MSDRTETTRVEAFSDGVFAIAITLLILEIRVPHETRNLAASLAHLWPSYLAFFASFATIGVMWLNHHRLFSLIHRLDDGLIGLNLLLLLGVTWIPFPTAVLAQHLREAGEYAGGVLYGGSFFFIAIVFNVLWRYAVAKKAVVDHADVAGITRQYAIGPIAYLTVAVIGAFSGAACLVVSALIATYFALPLSLWRRNR